MQNQKKSMWCLFLVLVILIGSNVSPAQRSGRGGSTQPTEPLGIVTLKALSDFPILNAGEVPYYKDNGRQALAINAGNSNYRDKFARAVHSGFKGKSGIYNVELITVKEFDGESSYHLLINGKIVAEFQNPYIGPDGTGDLQPHTHTWEGIAINEGDEIAVESNTHSNGDIPEGSGFAWARGRWRQIKCTWVAPPRVPLAHLTLLAQDTGLVDVNDPNSDTLALDLSGNKNHGLLEGDIAWIDDSNLGTVMDLDGIDDRITIVSDANFIDFNHPFSITFWIKTDVNDSNNVILTKSNGNETWDKAEKMVEIISSTSWGHTAKAVPVGAIQFEGSWCNGIGGTTDVTDGLWHHVAITWEGEGTGVMYIDGVEETLTLNEYNGNFGDNRGDQLFIGWHDAKGSFQGSLVDLRIYNLILTAAEVETIMTTDLTPDPNEP